MNKSVIILLFSIFCFGVGMYTGTSVTTTKWELILKTEQNTQLNDYINKVKIQTEYTKKLIDENKFKEKTSWELYKNAEENYTTAMSDNNSLRVRIKQCTTSNQSGNVHNSTTSTDLGNGASEGQAELSDSAKRGIAEIGYKADRCEAKLVALQGYIDTLPKACLVNTIKE